jgi:hypothetical protein
MHEEGMASNLPALFPLLRLWIFILVCMLTCISALHRLGHEASRDVKEAVWNEEAPARHPVPTDVIPAAMVAASWNCSRLVSSAQQQQ